MGIPQPLVGPELCGPRARLGPGRRSRRPRRLGGEPGSQMYQLARGPKRKGSQGRAVLFIRFCSLGAPCCPAPCSDPGAPSTAPALRGSVCSRHVLASEPPRAARSTAALCTARAASSTLPRSPRSPAAATGVPTPTPAARRSSSATTARLRGDAGWGRARGMGAARGRGARTARRSQRPRRASVRPSVRPRRETQGGATGRRATSSTAGAGGLGATASRQADRGR